MKLTIEHLAPYLPYKLNVLHYSKVKKMTTGTGSSNNWVSIRSVLNISHPNCIPLLHPLSDLTKEHAESCNYHNDLEGFIKDIRDRSIATVFWNDLIKNYWDVFNLIPAGLAQDINTIEK